MAYNSRMSSSGREDALQDYKRTVKAAKEASIRSDFVQAGNLYFEAIKKAGIIYPPPSMEEAECLLGMADCYYKQDRAIEAKMVYQQAAGVHEKLGTAPGNELITMLLKYAQCLETLEEIDLADETLNRALNMAEDVLPPGHDLLIAVFDAYINLLKGAERDFLKVSLLEKRAQLARMKTAPGSRAAAMREERARTERGGRASDTVGEDSKAALLFRIPIAIVVLLMVANFVMALIELGSVKPLLGQELVLPGQMYASEDYSESLTFHDGGKAEIATKQSRRDVPYKIIGAGWPEVFALVSRDMWLTKSEQGLELAHHGVLYSERKDESGMLTTMMQFAKDVDDYLSQNAKFPPSVKALHDPELNYTIADGSKREPELQYVPLDGGPKAPPNYYTAENGATLTSALQSQHVNKLSEASIDERHPLKDVGPSSVVCICFSKLPTIHNMLAVMGTDKDGVLLKQRAVPKNILFTSMGSGVQLARGGNWGEVFGQIPDKIVVSSANKDRAIWAYLNIVAAFIFYVPVELTAFAARRGLKPMPPGTPQGIINLRAYAWKNLRNLKYPLVLTYIVYVGYVVLTFLAR